MLNKVSGTFSGLKDVSVSYSLKKFLKRKLKRYGKLYKLAVDSKEKTIVLIVLLKGENELIRFTIDEYCIVENNGKYYFRIDAVETSREWMTLLAHNMLVGHPTEISKHHAKLLHILL